MRLIVMILMYYIIIINQFLLNRSMEWNRIFVFPFDIIFFNTKKIFFAARTGAKSKRDICSAWTMACPWIFGKIKGMRTNDVHK